jgi:hypothetical protein
MTAGPPATGPAQPTSNPIERGFEYWRRFWFEPRPMTTLGLVRIAFGLLVTAWTLSLLPDLLTLFGRDGVRPAPTSVRYSWGLLHIVSSDWAVVAVWVLLLLAALAVTVGWHTRLAALVVFVAVLSFQRRNIFVFNSGDVVLRIEALYLALAPAGAALSLDRRRTAGSFWDAQVRAPWGLRLMQVQLSIIYLTTVHDKLTGSTWNDGTAVSYALRLTDLQAFALPDWLTTNAVLMNFATWGTLVLELSIGVLVWNRRLRPWVLGAGIVMHMIFVLTLAVAFFSFAMYVLYLSFVPEDTARRWVDRTRVRLATRSAADTPSPAAALETTTAPPRDAGREVSEAAAPAVQAGGVEESEEPGEHATARAASGSAGHSRRATAPGVPDAQPRTG